MTEIFKNKFPEILFNEEMKNHTTFKIGGPADMFLDCSSVSELIDGISLCKENNIPYMVIGNGSNMLVSDKGIEGMVFCVGDKMKNITVSGNTIICEAGCKMVALSNEAQKNSLSGLEFVAGIPGTLGGGIYMNAGAYGGELKDTVKKVTYIDESGELRTAEGDELDFSYRHSMFSGRDCVIISAELELTFGEPDKIKDEMRDYNNRRREKQPLEYPSAGSTFKRPEGYFAGKLIEDSGLRGFSIGGAQVSEKHSGFVINKGDATASDVLALIEHIKKTVFDKFGVSLEPEVRLTGRGF